MGRKQRDNASPKPLNSMAHEVTKTTTKKKLSSAEKNPQIVARNNSPIRRNLRMNPAIGGVPILRSPIRFLLKKL